MPTFALGAHFVAVHCESGEDRPQGLREFVIDGSLRFPVRNGVIYESRCAALSAGLGMAMVFINGRRPEDETNRLNLQLRQQAELFVRKASRARGTAPNEVQQLGTR